MLRASKKISSSAFLPTSADAISSWGVRGPTGRIFIHTSSPRMQQYNYGSESSGAATAVKVIGVTGLIVGMPLAYAAYDSKFRATVEGYVPFLKPVLDKISPAAAGPPTLMTRPDQSKPKFDPPSAPLSFTPGKPVVKIEKKEVIPEAAPKQTDEKASPVVDRDAGLKNVTVKPAASAPPKTVIVEKPPGAASPLAAVTVDKIVQVGADSYANAKRENEDLKPDLAVANSKNAGSDTKVQILQEAGREALDKAQGRNLLDLVAFLDGRQLTAEEERLVQAVVTSTADRMQAEFEQFIDDLENEHEWELQTQLKRQISAHAGTVLDALKRQESELEKHFQTRLERRLDEERQRFNLQVAGALGRVQGIEEAMINRSRAEKLNQKSQYLWHASHALYDAVEYGNLVGHTSEDRMVPLSKYVTLAKIFSDSHPFVLAILRAVPEEALVRGVLTEDALRERFHAVKRTARRVAMINEQDNSLFRYLLSYTQSLLVRDEHYDLTKSQELDVTSLDTFRLLASAQQSVRQGDLATAIRLVGQLQGEPRKVAQDWLKEARLHLETQQIAKLLLAHASAVGLSNVPVDERK